MSCQGRPSSLARLMILSSMSVTFETEPHRRARTSAGSGRARRTRGSAARGRGAAGRRRWGRTGRSTPSPARAWRARAPLVVAVSYRRSTAARLRAAATDRAIARRLTRRRCAVAWRFVWPGHRPGARTIPDKPTLDGIEDRWSERWEADGIYRFDRTAGDGRRLLDRHAAADRVGFDPHGHRVRLHPVRRRRPLPADARQGTSSSRSAGTTTAWPPSAGCRTTTACAATRRSRTTPASQPPFRGDVPEGPPRDPDLAAQLHRPVRGADGDRRGRVRGAVPAPRPCRSTGRCSYTTDRRRQPPGQPARVPPQPRPRRGLQRRRADRVGRRRPHRRRPGRDRGPRAARRLPPHRVPRPATATSLIDTTRPELIVSCVALVAHPDDERYQPLFGTTVRTPLFGVEVPVVAHPLAQPDKGTGIAMVCTFGDTTDVTWWRELDLPTRSVIGRDGRFLAGDAGVARPRRRRGRVRRARRPDGQAGPGGHRRAAPRVGRAARRAAADHPPREVLRARPPPARDRHQPPVVHPQRRARRRTAARRCSPAARSWPGTPTTCATATTTGSRASTATG